MLGKFRFSYPKNKAQIVLEFSFVGMQTTSVKYAGQKEIDVILYEDQKELDEVVVTGYQVLDKRTQTSAITTVKAEDIMIPGVTSIDQMLEGRIPEMTFMLNSGEVGATPVYVSGNFYFAGKPGASVGIGRYRDDRPCRCRSRRFE